MKHFSYLNYYLTKNHTYGVMPNFKMGMHFLRFWKPSKFTSNKSIMNFLGKAWCLIVNKNA